MNEMQALILAAGKSTRMGLNGSKLLYKYEGKTIIRRVVEACSIPRISKINLVVGYDSERIIKELGNEFNYYYQSIPTGTGDALKIFFDNNTKYEDELLVMVADTPLIDANFVENFTNYYYDFPNTLVAVTNIPNNIPPFARVIRDTNKKIQMILEDFECNNEQKKITELVTSQYCFNSKVIKPFLTKIKPHGKNNQTYLNDLINEMIKEGVKINTYFEKNFLILYGVNDFNDLNFLYQYNKTYDENYSI